ncbi:universal stress protein [Glutamicibacter sp. BSL13]
MKLLIGYTADERGAEAIELACALISDRAVDSLELAMVLPEDTPFQATYPGGDHGYHTVLSAQADRWAEQALALVPEGISARVTARTVSSVAHGLIELAAETGAEAIVLGGRSRHKAGFFAPGAVATSLLHASPVPVLMSNPRGVAALRQAKGRISRITAFVGDLPGAGEVIDQAVRSAERLGMGLRVATLVTSQEQAGEDSPVLRATRQQLDELTSGLGEHVEPEVVTGASIDEAIASIGWLDGELAVFGSSRLAPPRRLFLGSKAQRMLRHLPVPMAVVPHRSGGSGR